MRTDPDEKKDKIRDMEDDFLEKTVSKLAMAGNHFSTVSPGISRFYMSQIIRLRKAVGRKANDKEQMVCVYCGSVLRPGNHSVQLKPKVKTTPKILRLKRREEEGRPMGGYQRNMLDNYQKGTTSVAVRCHTCGGEDRTPCGNRRQKKPKLPQTDSVLNEKSPTLTRQMRRRLKNKEKRRKKQLQDSGFVESASSLTRTHSPSLSSISSAGSANNTSLNSVLERPLSSLPPPFASTPKLEQRGMKQSSLSFKSPTQSISLSTLSSVASPQGKSKNSTTSKKGKKNKNKGLSVLQKMLTQQNNQESKNRGSSLKQFLSAL